MNWSDLMAALALFLVIEGLLPALSPSAMRTYMEMVSRTDDKTARIVGTLSIAAGLLLLYAVRH